ncbi:uncharacterized protein LOC144197073 isoform X2 [Stigmatopora nigra]
MFRHQHNLTFVKTLHGIMEDNVNVQALRARFSRSSSSGTISNPSTSPRRSLVRSIPSTAERDVFLPTASPPDFPHVPEPYMVKHQRGEAKAAPTPPEPNTKKRTPYPSNSNNVKHTGEMLEKMMLGKALVGSIAPSLVPTSTLPLQLRSTSDVIPLRKPLPPEGPLPLKPKRPRNIHLQQFQNISRPAWPLLAHKSSEPRQISALGVTSPSNLLPQTFNPSRQEKQVTSVDVNNGSYDDIANLEEAEYRNNSSSHGTESGEWDIYEHIDEDQVRVNLDKKMEEQKRDYEHRRKFQLHAEEEILYTAKVCQDWYGGGEDDLRVYQDGYISNTCVDVDCEAAKREFLQLTRRTEEKILPPPPPGPPQVFYMESNNSWIPNANCFYDGFQLSSDDFPPPPPRNEMM